MRNLWQYASVAGVLAIASFVDAGDEKEKNLPKKKPNILVIYTDDQSYRTLSCYPGAYPWAKTPNLDRLAKMGIRFSAAYNGSWCAPSRASILTGHHPFGVQSMTFKGQYPSSSYDPEQCRYWPAVFRRLGYFTGQIGKWHTGADAGFGRDWDYQAVWNRPALPENAANYYKKQLISFNGAKAKLVEGYPTDNYTDWAVDFIRGKNRDKAKPWFLWLCYGAPHGPFTPAERHKNAYAGVIVETPKDLFGPREGKPAYVRKMDVWAKGKSGEPIYTGKGDYQDKEGMTLAEGVRQYNQCVLAIDEGVGRLLKILEETCQLENTLIVFTSDQGYAWGYHGFRHKLGPYDDTIRSPLIFAMRGTLPKGKTCPMPVAGVDFAPTFFRFAGFDKLPWKMHGRDLTPLLKDPGAAWNEPMLVTHTGRSFGKDTHDPAKMDVLEGVPWWVALRHGKLKYIRTLVENEIEELYDLDNDPDELTNLALRPEHRLALARLRNQTIAELRRTEAGFVDKMPLPTTAVAQEKNRESKPKEIDKATLEAWEKRGFKVGWMGIEVHTGEVVFAADRKKVRDAMPTFQSSAAVKNLKDLPPVEFPFGLFLDNRTRVTDEELNDLAELKNLTSLDLRGALVPAGAVGNEDESLKKFAGLTSLALLHLSGPQVTDAGVKELARLKNLTTLSLAGARVKDAWLWEH